MLKYFNLPRRLFDTQFWIFTVVILTIFKYTDLSIIENLKLDSDSGWISISLLFLRFDL